MTKPSETPPADLPPALPTSLPKRPFYKQIDFWIGFVGWWAVNAPLYWWLTSGGRFMVNSLFGSFLMLPVTLIVLLIAAFRRRHFAGGILVAIATNLMLSVLLGTLGNAVCGVPFFLRYR